MKIQVPTKEKKLSVVAIINRIKKRCKKQHIIFIKRYNNPSKKFFKYRTNFTHFQNMSKKHENEPRNSKNSINVFIRTFCCLVYRIF